MPYNDVRFVIAKDVLKMRKVIEVYVPLHPICAGEVSIVIVIDK